jgi:hypothetical protein
MKYLRALSGRELMKATPSDRGVRAANVNLQRPNVDPQPIELHRCFCNKARMVVGTSRAADCRLRNNAGGFSHTKVEANHNKLAFSREANGEVPRSISAERTKRVGEVRRIRHGGMKCVWVCVRTGSQLASLRCRLLHK